jgi:ribosomal protein S18 acetylase RimI-like enzyme
MDDVTIRQALGSDLPYLYEICLKTGASGKDASADFRDPYLLGQFYAAPYLFGPGALAFVAESGGIPRGYILCGTDTAAFNRWLESEWLPPLRRRYSQAFITGGQATQKEAEIAFLINMDQGKNSPPYLAEYPAHLHIDLLPDLQGRGMGRRLMETLFSELRRRGVPGLHLGVALDNEGAIAFYQKMGFSDLEKSQWSYTMGIRL